MSTEQRNAKVLVISLLVIIGLLGGALVYLGLAYQHQKATVTACYDAANAASWENGAFVETLVDGDQVDWYLEMADLAVDLAGATSVDDALSICSDLYWERQ